MVHQSVGWVPGSICLLVQHCFSYRNRSDRRRRLHGLLVSWRAAMGLDGGFFGRAHLREQHERERLRVRTDSKIGVIIRVFAAADQFVAFLREGPFIVQCAEREG